jgi:hypothetical protein
MTASRQQPADTFRTDRYVSDLWATPLPILQGYISETSKMERIPRALFLSDFARLLNTMIACLADEPTDDADDETDQSERRWSQVFWEARDCNERAVRSAYDFECHNDDVKASRIDPFVSKSPRHGLRRGFHQLFHPHGNNE